MKQLTQDLLETRRETLKRRNFIRSAPAVIAFVLASGAAPVRAEYPVIDGTEDGIIDPV